MESLETSNLRISSEILKIMKATITLVVHRNENITEIGYIFISILKYNLKTRPKCYMQEYVRRPPLKIDWVGKPATVS